MNFSSSRMLFRNSLTLLLLASLGVVCYAKTYFFQFKNDLDSLKRIQDEVQDVSQLFSKTKEFTWGSRHGRDYRIMRKNDRTRRGSNGTKHLNIKYDGIEKVTEIHLEVTSDSKDVEAKIIKGGIGKDRVTIEVTGRDTSYLEYHVEIYGEP